MLHGDDTIAGNVYEVVGLAAGGDRNLCRLRQLHWNRGDVGAGKECLYNLGDGDGETYAWSSADERYLLVVDVALGRCKDFGREEPNIKGGKVPREPAGFHSVCMHVYV